jgi:hypothetical protein
MKVHQEIPIGVQPAPPRNASDQIFSINRVDQQAVPALQSTVVNKPVKMIERPHFSNQRSVETDLPGLPDDFETRAREVLGDENPKLLADLLALRSETTRFAAQKWPGFAPPNAATLNARNQHLIEQAAKLLGPEKFTAIFGFAPDQKIDLVDPNIQQGR